MSEETINNCFRKARFFRAAVDLNDAVVDGEAFPGFDEDEVAYNFWRYLNLTASFDDYVTIDADIETSDFPTDADIVDDFLSKSAASGNVVPADAEESDEENHVATMPDLASSGAMHALNVVQRYFSQLPDSNELLDGLNKCEVALDCVRLKSLKQAKLTDYFAQK